MWCHISQILDKIAQILEIDYGKSQNLETSHPNFSELFVMKFDSKSSRLQIIFFVKGFITKKAKINAQQCFCKLRFSNKTSRFNLAYSAYTILLFVYTLMHWRSLPALQGRWQSLIFVEKSFQENLALFLFQERMTQWTIRDIVRPIKMQQWNLITVLHILRFCSEFIYWLVISIKPLTQNYSLTFTIYDPVENTLFVTACLLLHLLHIWG